METPSPGPSSSFPENSAPDPPPERGDRDVVAYLANDLLPALGDRAPRALRDAVRRAIRERHLAPLQRLSGRHRTELLLVIEQTSETRRRPSPAVMVRLTTVVSATPAAPDLVEVSATRPAR
ncbi:MAG: hypothetical protein WA688_02380 [Thermoplasmata archaeon]